MSGYCAIAPNHPVHASYHDTEYGFPVADERVLFERLALEIMQAGLSWEIVLKKRQALNKAFDGFAVAKVAAYGEAEIARLLADNGIIRNRLKKFRRSFITQASLWRCGRAMRDSPHGWPRIILATRRIG